MTEFVPIAKFGSDHWSTLAYIECVCCDGKLAHERMRCDANRHPLLVSARHASTARAGDGKKYPTRLAGGELLHNHDDWDCASDLEHAGFITWQGTEIHPVFAMTDLGWEVSAKLRRHRGMGGGYDSFRWPMATDDCTVEDRIAELGPAQVPGWTHTLPTVAGWYWVRRWNDSRQSWRRPELVELNNRPHSIVGAERALDWWWPVVVHPPAEPVQGCDDTGEVNRNDE